LGKNHPKDAHFGRAGRWPLASTMAARKTFQRRRCAMPMKTYVEFRSNDFPPYADEEDEINPRRFGRRLAEFLVNGLKDSDFEPQPPIAEDWGWVVPIKNAGFNLWIGCGNYDAYPDGFLCFIEPHTPFVRRFLFFGRIDVTARVASLREALDALLSHHPGIREIRWWTHEEFNLSRW
jgi:hypothetical protein